MDRHTHTHACAPRVNKSPPTRRSRLQNEPSRGVTTSGRVGSHDSDLIPPVGDQIGDYNGGFIGTEVLGRVHAAHTAERVGLEQTEGDGVGDSCIVIGWGRPRETGPDKGNELSGNGVVVHITGRG